MVDQNINAATSAEDMMANFEKLGIPKVTLLQADKIYIR
jgi:hypothetical protein